MGGRGFVLLLALLAIACGTARPLTDHGAVLSVERGGEYVARNSKGSTEHPLRWRSVGPDRMTFAIEPGEQPLPKALVEAAGSGYENVRVRFPADGSGIAMGLLRGRTELTVDRLQVHAILVRNGRNDEFWPVAKMHLEGKISTQRWVEQVRGVEADPAPGVDLLDSVPVSPFRYKLCRGVDRAVALGYLGGPQSTWELAAVLENGEPARDWEGRLRIAVFGGYFGAIDGLEAIIRRHAFGSMRGKHYYAVPLSHVVLASELEQDGRTWSWSGLAYVRLERPKDGLGALPDDLPDATIRIEVVENRRYRSGLTKLGYAIVKPLSVAYSWVVGQVLYMTGRDAWADMWDEWDKQNRKKPQGQP